MTTQLKQFIRLKRVIEVTGLSRSTIYSLMKNGNFPAKILLGERAVAWDLDDILEWQRQRIESSRNRLGKT